jgi:hypothetical protein
MIFYYYSSKFVLSFDYFHAPLSYGSIDRLKNCLLTREVANFNIFFQKLDEAKEYFTYFLKVILAVIEVIT